MSSPLARPRPGEPRYFVKRSPGGVSPAKMMSREEAAEMMMRTEFSAFSRGVDADVSASATPEKRPESPQATRAADTDKVAARLVAAANAPLLARPGSRILCYTENYIRKHLPRDAVLTIVGYSPPL